MFCARLSPSSPRPRVRFNPLSPLSVPFPLGHFCPDPHSLNIRTRFKYTENMFASFRSVLTLTLAAVFATSCVALPSTSGHSVAAKRGLSPIEIDIGSIVQPIKNLVTPTPTKRMTNAQRMARGLPPNPPHRRSGPLSSALLVTYCNLTAWNRCPEGPPVFHPCRIVHSSRWCHSGVLSHRWVARGIRLQND